MSCPRMLPWDCGCHDPVVFGHRHPCVMWESEPILWHGSGLAGMGAPAI